MNKDTLEMLDRVQDCLWLHNSTGRSNAEVRADVESLRRISMTLHRWHELECGDSNDWHSWTVARGCKDKGGAFEYDDAGATYLESHSHNAKGATYTRIPDRERGAQKRLAKIMERYPAYYAYVQGDPRGCALYIVPKGETEYFRGIAVCR